MLKVDPFLFVCKLTWDLKDNELILFWGRCRAFLSYWICHFVCVIFLCFFLDRYWKLFPVMEEP